MRLARTRANELVDAHDASVHQHEHGGLAEGGDANACAALSDAREATELCSLAGEGWYRLLDAAEASGDEPTATAARDELTRLGYSLEAGEEGMQAQDAKPAMKLDYWGRPMA